MFSPIFSILWDAFVYRPRLIQLECHTEEDLEMTLTRAAGTMSEIKGGSYPLR
jgi:hypothetical protein